MKKIVLFIAAFFLLAANVILVTNVNANDAPEEVDIDLTSGDKLPRMASLRSNQVNARSGPGSRYPIEWIYMQKNAPVEILAEFELWRKIKDWEGSESWVHKPMLSSRRMAKITKVGEADIHSKPEVDSKVLSRVESGVVGEIRKCPSMTDFCLIRFKNIEGWVQKGNFFGVYGDEVID